MRSQASLSDEADPLYRSLGGLEAWASVEVDRPAWAEALGRLGGLDPESAAMAERGAMLAAAYRSAALDGVLIDPDPGLAPALVRGTASLASLDDADRAHVRANLDALELACAAPVSEATIRRLHEVACRPQLTHRVLVEGEEQDHVMAPGDYKHHPNHVRLDDGSWRATVPVTQLHPEMERLVHLAAGAEYAALHPAVQAAWLHHALLHVQPFADGNGRVARALASGCLLRAASVPLVVLDDDEEVDVVRAVVDLVDLMASTDPAAVAAWRERSAAAEERRRQVVPALERALQRPDAARRADVSAASVGTDLVVRVPGVDVQEVLVVDAHPLDDGPLTVTAQEAGLRLLEGEPVQPWADRVASVLALRVAADME